MSRIEHRYDPWAEVVDRREYWRKYYLANRERKIKAAATRNRENREEYARYHRWYRKTRTAE